MIITRSPLRISIGGGGTDIKSYYSKFGGFCISASIDKYVYTAVHQTVVDEMIIKYSQMERVKNINDIQHPIIREVLKLVGINNINLEITSMADIPAGTGLGSSSTFTCALLKALHTYKKNIIHQNELAEQACHIEIDLLKEPIGKQDQYISSYGGINCFTFNKDDSVDVKPLKISEETLFNLEDNLLLFFTGYSRSASSILKEQDTKSKQNDESMIDNLHHVKQMGYDSKMALESGDLEKFADIMNIHWQIKKERSKNMSNGNIDKWYDLALKNGAMGGKLCFIPKTEIKIENGYKYIKDILPNERVYDYKNNLQNVLSVMKSEYYGKIIEFEVNGLKDVISVTPDHPFFTTKKDPQLKREFNEDTGKKQSVVNLPIFKEAKYLKKGECLLIPVNTEIIDVKKIKIERKIKQPVYSNCNIYENIPEEIDVNHDFLNTIGWFIAEGSANHKQFQFTMNIKELDDANIIANTIKNMFYREVSIKPKDNTVIITGSSVVLCSFFNELCGKYAENKQIPSFVMKLPIEKQAVLISALWKGDGGIRKTYDKRTKSMSTVCYYKTVSYKLAKQIQELCFRLGYICSIKEYNGIPKFIHKNKKQTIPQTVYIISINGEDAMHFKNFIESGKIMKVKRSNKKQISLSKEFVKIEGIIYAKRSIRKIKETNYNGDVFNLCVENTHTYIANDIAVHNCGAGGGGLLLFYSNDNKKLRHTLAREGLKEVRFKFDFEGSKVI